MHGPTVVHVDDLSKTHLEYPWRRFLVDDHVQFQSGIRKPGMFHLPSRRVQTFGLLNFSQISKKRSFVIPANVQNFSMSACGVSSPRFRSISIASLREMRPLRISKERLSKLRVKPNLYHLSQW